MRGVDSLTDYYDIRIKRQNLNRLAKLGISDVAAERIDSTNLREHLRGVDAVLHCAAQPGVRASWDEFHLYTERNIDATFALLRAMEDTGVEKIVYSSSSSVYGDAPAYPVGEDAPTVPASPYGVTKLAAELLVRSFADKSGLNAICTRYFTVYGPGQRPDMALYRLIYSALTSTPFPLFGDGSNIRDFTFIDDVADANLKALESSLQGCHIVNIAGGESCPIRDLINLVSEITGRDVQIEALQRQPGDVSRTGGTTDRARELLGWGPSTSLRTGVTAEVEWLRQLFEPKL